MCSGYPPLAIPLLFLLYPLHLLVPPCGRLLCPSDGIDMRGWAKVHIDGKRTVGG